jgi:hypothetical protein
MLMAQVLPCSPCFAPPVKNWFDTGGNSIGTFRFRGGRQAPTTRGLIHETPFGRRFIMARPSGFPAPPWQRDAWYDWHADLAWSARRALSGQTPRRLMLMLVTMDLRRRAATLYPVFDAHPTQDDQDQTSAMEAEVTADFVDCADITTHPLLARGKGKLHLPQGMVAYRRRG